LHVNSDHQINSLLMVKYGPRFTGAIFAGVVSRCI